MEKAEYVGENDIGLESMTRLDEDDNEDTVTALPNVLSRTLIHRRSFVRTNDCNDPEPMNQPPPSFAQSEFETIIRRQRNNQPHMLKIPNTPSRFPNLDNLWEFAGWGSTSYVELVQGDFAAAALKLDRKETGLNALHASSIAGNDMYGSVFYAFPSVAAISGIFSPISLLVATLILFLFRPIFLELGSAIRFNGAIYAYYLQTSGKTMALVAAAALFLDGVATASVSAATASAYMAGEVDGALSGMKESGVAVGILLLLGMVGLLNLRESSRVTLSFTAFHLLTMAMLMIASIIAWIRSGTEVIRENWQARPHEGNQIALSVFRGICLSFLGVTGFETLPTYIEHIQPASYRSTLTTCIYTVIFLNAPLMLLTYALLPEHTILSGGNVLSLLAERAAGKWLRYMVVVDCVLVVAGGGVLAGLVAMCSLLQRLANDRVIPSIFLKTLPTGSTHWSVALFTLLSIVLYASSGFQLDTISSVFSTAFLVVMLLYAASNFLLKFNRDRLPREYKASLALTAFAFAVIMVVLIGTIEQSPLTIGLFLAYFIATLVCLLGLKSRIKLARLAMWFYDHITALHTWKFTKGWDASIVKWMESLRSKPVCVWVKNDEIYNLVSAILYVRRNELTSRIIFVHAYQDAMAIPSELEANIKILDEAFPSTTLDLVFLKGIFNPTLVEAASAKLEVPKSQMFMNTMGSEHGFTLADYGGVRVANL